MVFLAPEAAECFPGVWGVHGLLEAGVMATEKEIGLFFKTKLGGNGGLVTLTEGDRLTIAALTGGIVGQNREGKS